MALNAAVEPILIRDRRAVMVKVIRTALRGMFQPGLTYKEERVSVYVKMMDNGNYEGQAGTYICNEGGKWQSLVSSEGPGLARCGSYGANAGRGDIDNENGGHD